MIDPKNLPVRLLPVFLFERGLHRTRGIWARAEGVMSPVVRADRMGRGRPGWKALYFHETLHCVERHALTGMLFLVPAGATAYPTYAMTGSLLLGYANLVAGVLGWAWWQREQEVRADAFAWQGAGAQEFYAFVRMLPALEDEPDLPAGWGWLGWARRCAIRASHAWYRWTYAPSVGARVERAKRRAERTTWHVPRELRLAPSSAGASESTEPTAASSSPPRP